MGGPAKTANLDNSLLKSKGTDYSKPADSSIFGGKKDGTARLNSSGEFGGENKSNVRGPSIGRNEVANFGT